MKPGSEGPIEHECRVHRFPLSKSFTDPGPDSVILPDRNFLPTHRAFMKAGRKSTPGSQLRHFKSVSFSDRSELATLDV